MNIKSMLNLITLIFLSFFLTAVHATEKSEESYNYNYAALNNHCEIYDPYEPLNRKIFFVNGALDTFILRPVTKIYGRFTPDYAQQRVSSFVSNISEPLSAVNYGLQAKSNGVLKSFWRFVINSTFGVFGLFDVASKFGLTSEPQSFSNTLAHYGVAPGPYIVLPIYGGMSVRDLPGSLPGGTSAVLQPLTYITHQDFKAIMTPVKMVSKRNEIMSFTDHISKNSPDPYIAMRNAILNQSEAKMIYPEGFKCPAAKK